MSGTASVSVLSVEPDWPDAVETDDAYTPKPPIESPPEYRLLVPLPVAVVDDDRELDLARILRTATAITAQQDGSVLFACVLVVDDGPSVTGRLDAESLDELGTDLRDSVETATEVVETVLQHAQMVGQQVAYDGVVGLCSDVADFLEYFVEHREYGGVLLLTGADEETELFGRDEVESLTGSLDCDVLVERLPRTENRSLLYVPQSEEPYVERADSEAAAIESVLLVTHEHEHGTLVGEVGRAFGRVFDADVDVVAIDPAESDSTPGDSDELHSLLSYIVGSDNVRSGTVGKHTDLQTSDRLATDYDAVVFDMPGADPELVDALYAAETPSWVPDGATIVGVRSRYDYERSLVYRYRQAIDAETRGDQ